MIDGNAVDGFTVTLLDGDKQIGYRPTSDSGRRIGSVANAQQVARDLLDEQRRRVATTYREVIR